MGGYDDLDVQASLGLAAEPASARLARRFMRDFCTAADLGDDVCETAALLVSELVTNAVIHARSEMELGVQMRGDRIRVEVVDRSDEPVRRRGAEGDDQSGRGMDLVESLAAAWGIERLPGGKCVWFEVERPAAGEGVA